jgi:hypothetical protein
MFHTADDELIKEVMAGAIDVGFVEENETIDDVFKKLKIPTFPIAIKFRTVLHDTTRNRADFITKVFVVCDTDLHFNSVIGCHGDETIIFDPPYLIVATPYCNLTVYARNTTEKLENLVCECIFICNSPIRSHFAFVSNNDKTYQIHPSMAPMKIAYYEGGLYWHNVF